MDFKTIRLASGMTQKKFSEYFNIPRRTIEDWEAGKSKSPKYVLELIQYKLEKEGKQNMNTYTIEFNNHTLRFEDNTDRNTTLQTLLAENYTSDISNYELFIPTGRAKHTTLVFHADAMEWTDAESTDFVYMHEIMDEEMYSNTVLANASDEADFSEYGPDAKVLVAMITPVAYYVGDVRYNSLAEALEYGNRVVNVVSCGIDAGSVLRKITVID